MINVFCQKFLVCYDIPVQLLLFRPWEPQHLAIQYHVSLYMVYAMLFRSAVLIQDIDYIVLGIETLPSYFYVPMSFL